MPPEGLTVVWCQIDLDINGRVEKLRERLGEYLELGRGPFGIPHEQGMAATIIPLCLLPSHTGVFVYKASTFRTIRSTERPSSTTAAISASVNSCV
jgi:hypothetical protein